MSAPRAATGIGLLLGLVGAACAAIGVHAHRDVRTALGREGVTGTGGAVPTGAPVNSARRARAMAETIRESTLEASGGLTYAQLPAYVDANGLPTSDGDAAAPDAVTGRPVRNPDVDLWLQSMTLQSSLMQAYMGFRLAQFTTAVGGSLAAAGLGVALAARRG